MRWNNFSIPRLQQLHHWTLGMDKFSSHNLLGMWLVMHTMVKPTILVKLAPVSYMMRLMQTALHNNVQQPFPWVPNVLASCQEDRTPWWKQGNCKTVVTSKFWYVKSSHGMIIYWWWQGPCWYCLNSSPSGQSDRHFAEYIFRCIFVNEMFCILI